jgi:hypothetical protein
VEGITEVTRLADVFVDKKDMWTASRKLEHDDDEMVEMMMEFSKAAQAWDQLLIASGGLLALHKCFWWLVGWRWENGMTVLLSKTDLDVSLYLENGNDDAKCKI